MLKCEECDVESEQVEDYCGYVLCPSCKEKLIEHWETE